MYFLFVNLDKYVNHLTQFLEMEYLMPYTVRQPRFVDVSYNYVNLFCVKRTKNPPPPNS